MKTSDREALFTCVIFTLLLLTASVVEANDDTVVMGEWTTKIELDAITDEPGFFALNLSESGINEMGQPIALIIRCYQKKASLALAWRSIFDIGGADVTHRIDKGEMSLRSWPLAKNGSTTVYPDDSLAFINSLKNSEKLVFRTTPSIESTITADFKMDGINEVIDNVNKLC